MQVEGGDIPFDYGYDCENDIGEAGDKMNTLYIFLLMKYHIY